MEIFTPKTTRRCTRLRVQIPVTMTSLDRRHAFAAECLALVVNPQGAGLQAPQALPIETPVMLNGLPGNASASGYVASCLPLGSDHKHFLIGVSLYNPANVWGIANPPEDWGCSNAASAAAGAGGNSIPQGAGITTKTAEPDKKEVWPFNVFSGHTAADRGRK
jgi:hypothetical protein